MNKKTHFPVLLFLFVVSIIVTPELFAQAPSISSFSPLSGPVGTNVTITGNNFSLTPLNNIVRIGAVKATVTSATATSITFTVPTGATYVPPSVTVNNLTSYAAQPFIITFPSCNTPFSSNAFSPNNFNSFGLYPIYISLADFDEDGKPEVIMPPLILRNTSNSGTIDFDPSYHSFPGGSSTYHAGIADIDGDGKLDIAIGGDTVVDWKWDITKPILHVDLNESTGPGNIAFASFSILDIPGALDNLQLKDMDGDGRPDLIVPGGLHWSVTYILRNTTIAPGSVSFGSPVEITVPDATIVVKVGDIDGDGKQDMLTRGPGKDSFTVFRNTSSGIGDISFAPAVNYNVMSAGMPFIGDLDGDGKNDVIIPSAGNRIEIFHNKGSNGLISLTPTLSLQLGTGAILTDLCIADIDGDAKPDLVVPVRDNDNNFNNYNNFFVFKNTSTTNSISLMQPVDYSKNLYSLNLAAGDLDGDGKPDLAITTLGDPKSFAVFHNDVCSSVNLCAPAGSAVVTTNLPGKTYQWQLNSGNGFNNINNDNNYTNVNSSSLQLNNIPSGWYGYQYRCVTDDTSGSIFTLKFTNSWIGTTDSSWENSSNWSCGTVPDENTDVIIKSGNVVLNSNTSVRSMELNNTVSLTINSPFILNVTH